MPPCPSTRDISLLLDYRSSRLIEEIAKFATDRQICRYEARIDTIRLRLP